MIYLVIAVPAVGQVQGSGKSNTDVEGQEQLSPPPPSGTLVGRTANAGNGQVGQRQTRDEAAIGVKPIARIASRIENRVESRLRTRIDRDYNPQVSAIASISTASDRARTGQR